MEIITDYDFNKLIQLLPDKLPYNRQRPNVSGVDLEVCKRRNINLKGHRLGENGEILRTDKGKIQFSPHFGNKCESITLGWTRQMFRKKEVPFTLSLANKKHPELYEELKRAIKVIDPEFESDSITVNHNLKCKKHKDGRNVGDSIIVGLGDYKGGELQVDDKIYDINRKPLKFNGSKLFHETLDFEGDRWSFIWFKKMSIKNN